MIHNKEKNELIQTDQGHRCQNYHTKILNSYYSNCIPCIQELEKKIEQVQTWKIQKKTQIELRDENFHVYNEKHTVWNNSRLCTAEGKNSVLEDSNRNYPN